MSYTGCHISCEYVTNSRQSTKKKCTEFFIRYLYYITLNVPICRSGDRASWQILIIKPNRCTNFSQIYFWNKTVLVSDSSPVHHQEFFTVHTSMVYVMQVTVTACEQDQHGTALILLASCQQICMTYTIAVCTVKNSWWWTKEMSETCRVLFQK